MIQYIHRLLQLQLALFFIVQVVLLCLQGAALRRHGHRCFQLLVGSTVCGLLLLIASGAMLVFTPTETLLVWCYSLTFIFGIGQAFLGLGGVASLFRDYRRLTEHFGNSRTEPNTNDRNA